MECISNSTCYPGPFYWVYHFLHCRCFWADSIGLPCDLRTRCLCDGFRSSFRSQSAREARNCRYRQTTCSSAFCKHWLEAGISDTSGESSWFPAFLAFLGVVYLENLPFEAHTSRHLWSVREPFHT